MNTIFEITSRQSHLVIAVLNIRKNPSAQQFVIEGIKFINDMPVSSIEALFTTNAQKYAELIHKLLVDDKKVYNVTKAVMQKLCKSDSGQELLAIANIEQTKLPEKLIICDDVQDPGNVGSIIRTATAFGFGCILSPHSANPYTQKAIQSTAGAIAFCHVERRPILPMIEKLKKQGYSIISAEIDSTARCPCEISHGQRFAIVIGNEGSGVSNEISKVADSKIYIPIQKTNSLNASVAAGIFMYCFG